MSPLWVTTSPLSSSNSEFFVGWLGPFTQAEAPGQCEGFLGPTFFRKSWSFRLEKSSQWLQSFPWKLPSLQQFLSLAWAWTPLCCGWYSWRAGDVQLFLGHHLLVLFQPWWHLPWMSLVVLSQAACVHSVHQHPGARAALPRLLVHPVVLPQRAGWAMPAASTTAGGECTATQLHMLSSCKSHKPFY